MAVYKVCRVCGDILGLLNKVRDGDAGYICRNCYNKGGREYYYSRRKKHSGESRKWRENNRERYLQYNRKWARDNSEKIKTNARNWIVNNPEQAKLKWVKREFRERNAEGSFTLGEWKDKLKEYNYHCAYCGKELSTDTITIDHVIPLSRGGSNYIVNLVPACRSCNSRKHNKTAEEFVMTLLG